MTDLNLIVIAIVIVNCHTIIFYDIANVIMIAYYLWLRHKFASIIGLMGCLNQSLPEVGVDL